MKVLDLFSGMGGWSEGFLQRGHHVVRVDNDPAHENVPCTIITDVMKYDAPEGLFDVVLASPPCQAFSLAASGTHMLAKAACRCGGWCVRQKGEKWKCEASAFSPGCYKPRPVKSTLWLEPRTEFGRLSVALVDKTLDIIRAVQPKYWWMENPNGGMIHFVNKEIPRVQVTYCQYGEDRMKLTNLWGQWPDTWTPMPRCKNGDPCHVAAERGSKTGTQGIKGTSNRSLVPLELSFDVCIACEEAGL